MSQASRNSASVQARRRAGSWSERGADAVAAGDLLAARKCFHAAVKAESAIAAHRFHLAVVLEGLSDHVGAAEQLTIALRLDPAMADAARRLGSILALGRLPDGARLDTAGVRAALAHDTIDRDVVVATTLHYLARNGLLRRAVEQAGERGASEAARHLCVKRTGELLRDELFIEVLQRGVVSNLEFERLLTALRRAMLLEVPAARFADPQFIRFAVALMRQCWINEFVWAETPEETAALAAQRITREQLLSGDAEAGRTLLLHALYRPPATILGVAISPEDIAAIVPEASRNALQERLAEEIEIKRRAAALPCLGTTENETSRKVARQYGASPYPRWTSVQLLRKGQYLKHLESIFSPSELTFAQGPFEALVAGCGTGRQAVSVALDYGPNARVLAIDIAAPSLGYAALMAERMGARNVTFALGDILAIDTFEPPFAGRFHVIECTGVLHHMADPFAAWQSLIPCLAPGGIMMIGLYSAPARRGLESLQAEPAYPGPECDDAALRAYRAKLNARGSDEPGSEFRRSRDYYSTSGFRDLILHVSERRTRLEEIASFMERAGLAFRGFINVPFAALQERYPDAAWPGTLEQWAALEAEQPALFARMYQFWCTAR